VFTRGIFQGSRTDNPVGGQAAPISMPGAKLTSKNAQKKPKKNITSETMNKATPIAKPC